MRPVRTHRTVAALVSAALGALSLTVAAVPAHADAVTAPAAAPKSTAARKAPRTTAGEAAASAKAVSTGKAVGVPSATTPTEVESANPDGTFTLTQSATPVRKYTGGAWKALDATLVRHADGSVTPTLSTVDLSLSGGGSGALAVMKDGARTLSLTLPASIGDLPAPTLSGNSATYTDVLPGVDLAVTADKQGGFSETLVVKNAAAAAEPALAGLTFATRTQGLTPATDTAGNFTATDITGRTVFSAPAPTMWDSATPAATASRSAKSATPSGDSAGAGTPEASSAAAPGSGAHIAPVRAVYSRGAGAGSTGGTLALTPDASLLKSASTVYPLYIDPTYAAGGSSQGYTYTNSYYHSSSFWNTKDSEGLRVGYNGWDSPYYKANAYVRMSVSSKIYGATIDTTHTHFYATEIHSASCTAEPVELWTTGAISSATTWDNPPTWKTKVDTQTVAHGWSSSCPAASVGWDIHSTMQAIANTPASSVTFGLQAGDSGDKDQWKKFDPSTMTMTVTYDHKPEVPTPLTTSPARNCTGGTMGDGDVTLYAGVRDTDGGTVSATFTVTKAADGTPVTSKAVSAAGGTKAAFTLTKANLHSWLGTAGPTRVAWSVTASDGTYTSAKSTTCVFTFDPTRPGAPVVNDTAGADCSESALAYQVGTAASFTLVPNSSGTTPDHYLYQLNGAAPATTAGTTISITPTRGTNMLTVTAVSTGGNIGDTASCVIYAAPAATASDGDLTGDGHPDLTAVGSRAGLPSGYWLAHATDTGQISTGATDIGAQGTGANSAGSPADWNGTQAVTGHFANGAGFNDVLDYNPATGSGSVLYGNGDGATLSPTSGNQANVADPVFQDSLTGDLVTSVANGGSLYNTLAGYPTTGFPDLLVVIGGNLLDEGAMAFPGAFTGIDGALPLSSVNPTGTGDWTGWTLTTALDGNSLPTLFARDTSSGALYAYTPGDLQNLAMGNPAAPVQLATTGWSGTAAPILQAADLDNNGTPDLRKVDDGGNVTAYLFNGTALTAQTGQKISSPDHVWPLDDGEDGAVATTAADTSGSLNLTGSAAGATWDADDSLGNVLALDGTGAMNSSAALSMSAPFSVSLWAKPAVIGGVIASQDGTRNSGFLLYAQSNRAWSFCMAITDATRAYDCISGGTAVIGQWAHLTATYDPATKSTNLYVGDRLVAHGTHTAVTGFTGGFQLGDDLNAGAHASHYQGSISDVQTWNGTVLTTNQVATMANLPLPSAPYHFADIADYDGDGKPDLVAADATGSLWLYPGNGTGKFTADSLYIGSGFTGHTFAGVADFNGDGYADIIAMTPSGALHLYPGDAGHDLLTPSLTFVSGWSGYAFAGVRDFNKDGKPDLVGRDPSGVLYLYPGTGSGATIGSRIQLGTGFNPFTFAGLGDLDSDGNVDVIARDSTGLLWNYHGNGSNDVASPTQIGSGWNGYTYAGINDFNSDGNPDVIARDANGDLWLYPRTATAFSTRIQIGHGW
ncbi:FG-GAP-like repeat-containing protein [Streptomyces sp. NPDC021224]|uniref:FG-GAP-like repeat-containing protein n=1 Tax=unclassified Streptomyces TaxID=2593676 RepID=UPI0037A08DCE